MSEWRADGDRCRMVEIEAACGLCSFAYEVEGDDGTRRLGAELIRLTRDEVAGLIPHLQRFVETGRLSPEGGS